MEISRKRVVVGLSGGVDSSVALYALKKSGYEAIGVFLKYDVWRDRSNCLKGNSCCSPESRRTAQNICRQLGVPFFAVDVADAFKKRVIGQFISELKAARTPNPCVICNLKVKFAALLDFADSVGARFVATGHYAKVKRCKISDDKEFFELFKARDRAKDQSYSLCFLGQKELSRAVFPLGEMTKSEVYKTAASRPGFEVFGRKRESQDLCFLSPTAYPAFLAKEVGLKPGEIIDISGRVLGGHSGLHFFTIGQRKGINLPGGPYFVVAKKTKENELVVSRDSLDLAVREATLSPVNFVAGEAPPKRELSLKIRSLSREVRGAVATAKDGKVKIVFARAQKGATPGQIAAFYNEEKCLGGGVIN